MGPMPSVCVSGGVPCAQGHQKQLGAKTVEQIAASARISMSVRVHGRYGMVINKAVIVILAGMAGLSGCAKSSGILPMGPDTFTITTGSELGGVIEAKKQALTEANQFCMQRGQQLMPVKTTGGEYRDFAGDRIGTFDLMFRCLSPNDPDLQRPMTQPDVVIEVR